MVFTIIYIARDLESSSGLKVSYTKSPKKLYEVMKNYYVYRLYMCEYDVNHEVRRIKNRLKLDTIEQDIQNYENNMARRVHNYIDNIREEIETMNELILLCKNNPRACDKTLNEIQIAKSDVPFFPPVLPDE
jgi:hypothetical protein